MLGALVLRGILDSHQYNMQWPVASLEWIIMNIKLNRMSESKQRADSKRNGPSLAYKKNQMIRNYLIAWAVCWFAGFCRFASSFPVAR